MYYTSFWLNNFKRPNELVTCDSLPSHSDILIVGGGLTGLSTAYTLAKNGADVTLLEEKEIGFGASSRNAGFLTTGLPVSIPELIKRYGYNNAINFWQISLDAIKLIAQIIEEENIECDYQQCGSLTLASKDKHFSSMSQQVIWFQKELNHPLKLVSKSQLNDEIGSNVFFGGVLDEMSCSLHTTKYLFGLAKAAQKRGAKLLEQINISKIEKNNKGFIVYTQKGYITAKRIIIATNGYTTTKIIPELKSYVFPIGSYIIVTEVLSSDLQHSINPNKRVFSTSKNFSNYFRLTPDGRLLFGGRNNFKADLPLKESTQILKQSMLNIFPQLEQVSIESSWSGKLGFTFDQMPHIGEIKGVEYALGYCGKGIAMSTYFGTEIGLILLGRKKQSLFSLIPHKKFFAYKDNPWFLPWVRYYYLFKDFIN